MFGLSWGDEGKGKVVDLLCPAFDMVIRFNGGANAGHTVCIGDERFALHLLPTGALHDSATAVIGPGVAVDPFGLLDEIEALSERGLDVWPRLRISDRAHLVMPYHKIEDLLSERAAGDAKKLGTTSRGIGPCYADKMRRSSAFRFADLMGGENLTDRLSGCMSDRLHAVVDAKRKVFRALYGTDGDLDADQIVRDLARIAQRLHACVCDTTQLLHDAIKGGKQLLFEGANGMLLDVDHGTYPFVTSSSTGPHGIGPGAGVSADVVTRRVGVTKAYATRVGSGPFVSELDDAVGDHIRTQGHEFGTTTGRPRRCGWFDAVSNRYAATISGVTDVAVMHLDTLTGFERLGICVAYRVDGERVLTPPSVADVLMRATPEIEYMPGWQEDLRSVRAFDDLPKNARAYVARLESLLGAPVNMVGVGPERSQMLVRGSLQRFVRTPESTTA